MNSFRKRAPSSPAASSLNSQRSVFGAAKEETLESHAAPGSAAPSSVISSVAHAGSENQDDSVVELEHMIGFGGAHSKVLIQHPTAADTFIFAVGNVVVLGSRSDPHDQQILRAHTNEVCCIVVSPTGRYIVSGQKNTPQLPPSQLHLWNFEKRQLLTSIGSLHSSVRDLSFSPDENWLACATESNLLLVWDLSTGDIVSSMRLNVDSLAFGERIPGRYRRNPTYRLFTTSCGGLMTHSFSYDVKTMQYAPTSTKCEAAARAAIRREYTCSVLDNSKKFMLCGSSVGDVSVYNVENGIFRTHFPSCSNGVYSILEVSSYIFVGGGDGTLSMFEGSDQHYRLHDRLQLDGAVTNLSPNHDATEMLVGTNSGRIYRVKTASAETPLEATLLSQSPVGAVNSVAFGKRSDRFATLTSSGSLSIWDLSDYSRVCNLHDKNMGSFVQFDILDDNAVLTGGYDGSLRCFDIGQVKERWLIDQAVRGSATALAQHERLFAIGGNHSGSILLWDRKSRMMVAEYVGHLSPVTALKFDVDNTNLLHSCGSDRRRVTYDIMRRLYIIGHQVDNGVLTSITQKSNGEHETAVGVSDGRVIVFDTDLPDPVHVIAPINIEPINCVAASPSGRFLATVSRSGDMVVYSVADTVEKLQQCHVHSAPAQSVTWTPDEKQIVSVGQDSCICVFNFYDV